MGTEIDRLEVQVEAQATTASAQLDILVKKLDRVSASLSGVNSRGLATMGAGVNKLANAMNNFANNTKTTDFSRLSRNIKLLNDVDVSGLSSLSSSMKELASGLREISTVSFSAEGLNSIVSSLGRLGGVKATAGTQNLQSIKDDLTEFVRGMNDIGSLTFDVSSLSALLNNISKLGGASVQKAITNLPALATAMNDLMTTLSEAPAVSSNVIQMTNALANLAAQGAKVGSVGTGLTRSVNSVGNAGSDNFKKLSASMDILTGKSKKASSSLRNFSQIASGFYANILLITRSVKKLWTNIESSMDYVETFNYWNVTLDKIGKEFGSQFIQYGKESAEEYAESFRDKLKTLTAKMTGYEIGINGDLVLADGKNLGLDPEKLMSYQAKILAVTNSVGLMGETSTDTAKALSMLSADLSSFTNENLSTVMTNMQSGLIGQSRALYKYGIDITNATLQQYAYEYGITKTVTAMTQSEKMQLRLLVILDQSKVAWGDQANTLSSVANQYRILGQQVQNLGRILGNLFLPIVKTALPIINGLVISLKELFTALGFGVWGADWLKDLQDGISSGFDNSGLDDIADSVDDTTSALDEASSAAKKLNGSLQAFDELNVINTKTDSGSGSADSSVGTVDLSGAISVALADYESVWEKAFADSENKAQEYADIITGVFADMWGAVEPFRNAISSLWDNGLSKLADFTWTSLGDFYDNFLIPIGTWAFGTEDAGLTRLVNVVNDGLMSVDWERVNASLENFWIAIEPYTEQFGEGLVDFFEDVSGFAVDIINKLPDWLDGIADSLNNGDPEKARDWGYALGQLALGIGAVKLALKGFAFLETLAALSERISKLGNWLSGTKIGAFFAGLSNKIPSLVQNLGSLGSVLTSIFQYISPGMWGEMYIAFENLTQGTFLDTNTWTGVPKIINDFINNTIDKVCLSIGDGAIQIWDKLFNFDTAMNLFDKSGGWFGKISQDFKEKNWSGVGKDIAFGIGNGIMGALEGLVEPVSDLLYWTADEIGLSSAIDGWGDAIERWYNESVTPWFTKEKWNELGNNAKVALSDKWTEFTGWWQDTGVPNWWDSNVIPWFTKEKWIALGGNMKIGLSEKWTEFASWWQSTGLYKWWSDDVEPFFNKDAWSWDGIKEGLTTSWEIAIEAIKNVWNTFANWLNDKLSWEIAPISIAGKEIFGGTTINLGQIPTFSLGGFPEDGWFRASKGEYFGQFDDGTSYIANNNQIVDGVAAGVEEAAYRGMMRALAESGGSNVAIHVEGDPNGMFRVWKQEYKSEATRLQKNPVPIYFNQ